jgi:hypothetical protein
MNKTLKVATAYVLIGLTSAWFGFIIANYVGLYEAPQYNNEGYMWFGYAQLTKPSTYIFLTALISLAAFSGSAYRKADFLVAKKTPGALPVFRFATVGVVVSLVSLVIFALSAFFASFNNFSGSRSGIADQLTGVYIPIILAAAVAVFLILSATVYRKSEATVGKASPEQKRAKREAALAFIYPIVGTTLALLIGLTVYQAIAFLVQTQAGDAQPVFVALQLFDHKRPQHLGTVQASSYSLDCLLDALPQVQGAGLGQYQHYLRDEAQQEGVDHQQRGHQKEEEAQSLQQGGPQYCLLH